MTVDVPAGFAGVVSVSRGESVEFEQAHGLADRAHDVAWTPDTQFAIASGTKGFTACAVVGLIADGILNLDTTARSILREDLPLVAADVTIEQLLTHRSGIGDYVDEDLAEEVPLSVPVQDLDCAEAYLPALEGFPAKFDAGTRFSYCNSGYVLLAILAERASERSFPELLATRVFGPAGMTETAFLRSDELPGRAAIGYLDNGRTNVFKLPVVGTGDGGAYTTLADVRRFWSALLGGGIVAPEWVSRMTEPSTRETGHPFSYGMGFWLDPVGPRVVLDGCDHGVSFRSVHEPSSGLTVTVANNTTDGAWPVARQLRDRYFS